MNKLSIFLIILGFSLLFPINNASADFWAYGVTQSSGWSDAEKQAPNDGVGLVDDDDLLCWAASASDILMWSGWGGHAGFADEDDVFEFFINEDPVDAGGWQRNAWKFWFDGSQTGGHFSGSSHTGYYYTGTYYRHYIEYMNDPDVMSRSESLLRFGYGVGYGIFTGPTLGHAITLWGINTDAAGNYLGVWVTDSDNNMGGSNRRLSPNTLDYYNVLRSGSDWYLQNYGGINDWYIDDIQALQIVPVPAAVLLGILGLGVAGLKLRKFA